MQSTRNSVHRSGSRLRRRAYLLPPEYEEPAAGETREDPSATGPNSFYFVEFVTSKGQQEVCLAIQRMFCRIESSVRYSGARVIWRMHGDRAQELTGALSVRHGQTPEECTSPGRWPRTLRRMALPRERLRFLKQEARKLLLTTNASPASVLWPFAVLRASTLQRYRRLRIVPTDVAFGSSIVALAERGFTRRKHVGCQD